MQVSDRSSVCLFLDRHTQERLETDRSYLVCATPRSGSTLVCHALDETGVAGRPEEYFEALRHSGRPRRPDEYFLGVEDQSILDHLGERNLGDEPPPRSPLWSRAAYDRYLEWAIETGTTPNGVFGAKLMWGYFGDFVSLLRNVPALPRPAAGRAAPLGLPRAELRPGGAGQQAAPGGLAVEGGADGDLARGRSARPPRSRTTARRPTGASSRSTGRSFASTTGRSPTCSTRS